jgi:hypothetical protein
MVDSSRFHPADATAGGTGERTAAAQVCGVAATT